MLTADLVRPHRRGRELRLPPFDEKKRVRALELGHQFLEVWREHVGKTRDELDERLEEVVIAPRERILALGLRKLIEDRAEFEPRSAIDPRTVRRAVFKRAADQRRALGPEDQFDRARVLSESTAALDAPGV